MLSGAGFGFVGCAAAFQDKMDKWIHYAGAGVGMASVLIGQWVVFGMWQSVAVSAVLILFSLFFKNRMYWLEMAVFLPSIIGFYLI